MRRYREERLAVGLRGGGRVRELEKRLYKLTQLFRGVLADLTDTRKYLQAGDYGENELNELTEDLDEFEERVRDAELQSYSPNVWTVD